MERAIPTSDARATAPEAPGWENDPRLSTIEVEQGRLLVHRKATARPAPERGTLAAA